MPSSSCWRLLATIFSSSTIRICALPTPLSPLAVLDFPKHDDDGRPPAVDELDGTVQLFDEGRDDLEPERIRAPNVHVLGEANTVVGKRQGKAVVHRFLQPDLKLAAASLRKG